MTDKGWSPTCMPRRESEHSFRHPRYDGSWQGQTRWARPSTLVIEERKIQEEVSLSVSPDETD